MSYPIEEILVLLLLLVGVVGIYYALKMHYIFAFGLVQKTDISEQKKEKIEKIKKYVFYFLKVLLFLSLMAMLIFGVSVLAEGMSLKALVWELWQKIPEGFFLQLLWTLVRIAILILLMRYLLKVVYAFLENQESKTIEKKRYNIQNVKMVYVRLHNTIKYTVVLGVIYRIVHFFPFLLEVSYIFLMALILFFILAIIVTIKEVIQMLQTRK